MFFLVLIIIFFYENFDAAEKKSIEQLSNNQKTLLYSVQQKVKKKQLDSAIKEINDFLIKFPSEKHYLIYLSKGNIYILKNQKDTAIKIFKKGLVLNPGSIELTNNIAELYYEKKDFQKAADYFIITSENQKIPKKNILLLIASCYLNDENYISALETFKKGAYYYGDALEFKQGIIECLLSLERYDDALPICKQILKKHPFKKDIRLFLSQLYIQTEEYKNAIYELKKMVFLYQADKKIYLTLADLYSYFGMYNETINNYVIIEKSEMLGYKDLLTIAKAYYYSYKNIQALKYLDKALKLKPTKEILKLKCKIFFDNNQYTLALNVLKKIKKMQKMDGEIYYLFGLTYLQLNYYEKSEEQFHNAKLFENYKDKSLARIGDIKYYKGNIPQALAFYSQAYKLNPLEKEYSKMIKILQAENNESKNYLNN
jgi:tetratricopeptide (TPR) repeat protein